MIRLRSRRPAPLPALAVLAVLAVLALAGCTGGDDAADEAATTEPTTTEPTTTEPTATEPTTAEPSTTEATADWLGTDVCSLLPDDALARIFPSPEIIQETPVPAEDRGELPSDLVACSWPTSQSPATLEISLLDPPAPELLTDTGGPGATNQARDVEGGTAYVRPNPDVPQVCVAHLPSEPAWVVVEAWIDEPDLLAAARPDVCAVALDIGEEVLVDLGWDLVPA